MFADPGKAFALAVVSTRKSIPYYAIQVATAFLLSGAFHAATLPRDVKDVSMLRYAGFFWIQGLCVILEVLVSYATRHSDASTARPLYQINRRIVRFMWTVGVLYATVPIIVGE